MRLQPPMFAPSPRRLGLLALLLTVLVVGCAHSRKAYYLNGSGPGSEVRVEGAPTPVGIPTTGRTDPPSKSAEARREAGGDPVGQAETLERD